MRWRDAFVVGILGVMAVPAGVTLHEGLATVARRVEAAGGTSGGVAEAVRLAVRGTDGRHADELDEARERERWLARLARVRDPELERARFRFLIERAIAK